MARYAANQLEETIRDLRRTMSRIRSRGNPISEEDTKRVLVSPLLTALGWDTLDVEEVRSEYRHKPQDNPVDYALFILRTPELFVEAKALGKHLEDRKWVSQTIGYAATVGVEWCALTNGDEYRIYNAHAAVDAEDKLFRSVKISDEAGQSNTVETLRLLSKEYMSDKRLDVLWKVEIVDKRLKVAIDSLVEQKDDGLIRLLRRRARGLSVKDIKASLGRARVSIDFPEVRFPVQPRRPKDPVRPRRAEPKSPPRAGSELGTLIEAGTIAPPFKLQAVWRKQDFEATILPTGEILFDGKTYASLSTAAGMARNIANGPPRDGRKFWQTNGWTFWKYLDERSGTLLPLSALRRRSK